MKPCLPEEVSDIIRKFQDSRYEIYIVGGAVRDILMGGEALDWDFTTNAKPQEIQKLFKESYYENEFGTVGIPAKTEGLRPYEITTFRTEHGYSDARRPDKVIWGKTLEEDLKRRDFTINALALKDSSNGEEFELIDLFGGKKDLERRVIRAVGDPNERFSEDALRMMRAVRLSAQLNFKIESETMAAIKTNAVLISKISKERVRDELLKTLSSGGVYQGMIYFRESGLMELVLPELEKCFGVEQKSPQRHHIYDVGKHSLMSLKFCNSSDPILRLAVLIHDIGKPSTYKKQANGVITFYNHEVAGARIANQIADRLRLSSKQKDKLWRLARWHQFSVDERQTDSSVRRFVKNVGLENVEDMLELRRADRLGGGARETSWRTEEFKERLLAAQKQPFLIRDLKISGNDVMKVLNLKPGPKVGETLQGLFEKVVAGKALNERRALMTLLKTIPSDQNGNGNEGR